MLPDCLGFVRRRHGSLNPSTKIHERARFGVPFSLGISAEPVRVFVFPTSPLGGRLPVRPMSTRLPMADLCRSVRAAWCFGFCAAVYISLQMQAFESINPTMHGPRKRTRQSSRRCRTQRGGDPYGRNLWSASYTSNSLNPYTSRAVPGGFDMVGEVVLCTPRATPVPLSPAPPISPPFTATHPPFTVR